MALRIELKSPVVISGFPIEGVVYLDKAQALQDKASQLRVKCRGKLETRIEDRRAGAGAAPGANAAPGPTRRVHRDALDLVRWDAVLWKAEQLAAAESSAATSSNNNNTLALPFSFMTPANLPPDLDLAFVDCSASIAYYIEVRLERPGMLKLDRRERAPFRCMQPDARGADLKASLPRWSGQWKTLTAEDYARKVPLFGQKCYTTVEMDMPAVPVLPLWTPIPIRLRIMSLSKKMRRDEWTAEGSSSSSSNKPLFPSPPTQTRELSMKLEVTAFIKAGARLRPDNVRTYASSLADLGAKSKNAPLVVLPRVWVPDDPSTVKEKQDEGHVEGRWRQEAQCFTTLVLDCPPSFASPHIAVKYELQLEVPFEGLGNKLRCSTDITPVSGLLENEDRATNNYVKPPSCDEPQLPPYPEHHQAAGKRP